MQHHTSLHTYVRMYICVFTWLEGKVRLRSLNTRKTVINQNEQMTGLMMRFTLALLAMIVTRLLLLLLFGNVC